MIYALEGFYVVQSWRWHYFIPEYGLCALTVADFLGTKVAPWLERQLPILKQRSRELLVERTLVVCDRRLQWAGWPLMPRAQFGAQHEH